MKAFEDVNRYVEKHPGDVSAKRLAHLSRRLVKEQSLSLGDLYALDWDSFQLAVDMLRDWRVTRHYADQIRLPEGR